MTVTYKRGMLATMGTPGMKISQYGIVGGTYTGLTIAASDIGLSAIYSMSINKEVLDTEIGTEYLVAIGTFADGVGDANYATVRAHAIGTTKTVAMGNMQLIAFGM